MDIDSHIGMARSIEASLRKCADGDYEMKIEGAMLAGTHWLNALLHRLRATPPSQDVMHTYLLTVNEFRRLQVTAQDAVQALAAIEDARPPYVRGNHPGGERAAQQALDSLAVIRAAALAGAQAPTHE